jgi:hypothetical protein
MGDHNHMAQLSFLSVRQCSKMNRNSFHEKADPCQECFALSMIFSLLFPFSQAASVATLPSALFYERVSLGASWVFSMQ